MPAIGVIINPFSQKNRCRPNQAEFLRSILQGVGEVHQTRTIAQLRPIIRSFLHRHIRYWVVSGGDGTLHWVLRTSVEILEEDGVDLDSVTLPIIPTRGGTFNSIAESVGIRGTTEQVVTTLRDSVTQSDKHDYKLVDTMRIKCVQLASEHEVTFDTVGFVAVIGGIGKQMYDKYYQSDEPSIWSFLRVLATAVASTMLSHSPLALNRWVSRNWCQYSRDVFAPVRAKVKIDDDLLAESVYTAINVASLPINVGNVLRVFNKAHQAEALQTLVGGLTPLTVLGNLPRLISGKELRCPGLHDRICRSLSASVGNGELFAPIIDGERYRDLREITLRLGPRVGLPVALLRHRCSTN